MEFFSNEGPVGGGFGDAVIMQNRYFATITINNVRLISVNQCYDNKLSDEATTDR
jgi:hypothetical protein